MGRLTYRTWMEIKSWSNVAYKGCKLAMSGPDLVILHSNDAEEWDHYLSDCFKQYAEPDCIEILHEKVEDLPFPLPSARVQSFSSAKAVLVILSPDFLDFIDSHPEEVFDLGKLLKKNQTVAMLCGIKNSDVTSFHKASLVSYDSWPRLIARDQDRDFVLTVIRTTHEILERTSSIQKAQFKLAPRKVKEGNGKVFAILSKPLNEKQKIQLFLEGEGVREVPIKLRNPYTIQFVVPDSCMQGSKLMNVLVRCDDYLLGIRPLKCESKMGELYSLLSVVNSPYELLCKTMGVGSLHEMDAQLAKNFRKNLPPFGFSLLGPNHDYEKKKSEEELPTLLHFAARYGLKELSSQLLQCPGAAQACRLRNTRGLVPSQLANHAGYTDIAELLEDFTMVMEPDKSLPNAEVSKQFNLMTVVEPDKVLPNIEDTRPTLSTVYEQMQDCPSSLYDVPFPVPIPTSANLSKPSSPGENDYLGMFGFRPSNIENLEPHKKLLLGIDEPKELSTDLESPEANTSASFSEEKKSFIKQDTLCGSQQELIDIMEAYKKGVPFTEVSNLYECWQNKHRTSLDGTRDDITTLRKLYKECQKKQAKKMSGFTEVRNMLSNILGRKDSKARSPGVKTYQRPAKTPEKPEDGIRPVSTLSTVSSTSSSSSSSSSDRCSTLSMSSIYDSGNHSDSCDEGSKTKDLQIGNSHQNNSTLVQPAVCDRPPAPPPRPAVPPPISRIGSRKNSKHSYYVFPPIIGLPRNEQEELPSPDYVLPDNGYCVSLNRVEGKPGGTNDASGVPPQKEKPPSDRTPNNVHNQLTTKTGINKIKSLSLLRRNSCASSTSQNIKQSDECQYYDIPALPVPVGEKGKEKQLSLSESDESNYDIPKPLTIRRVERRGSLHREPTYIEVLVNNEDQNSRGDNLDYDIPKILKQDKTRHSSLTRETTTYTGVINPKQRKESSQKAANYYNITRSQLSEDQYDSIPDEMPPPPPADDDPYSVMMPSSSVQRCVTPPLPPRIKIPDTETK